MTRKEIERELSDIAARWREAPHLANDYAVGETVADLCDELATRFHISARIEAVGEPTNYQVRISE